MWGYTFIAVLLSLFATGCTQDASIDDDNQVQVVETPVWESEPYRRLFSTLELFLFDLSSIDGVLDGELPKPASIACSEYLMPMKCVDHKQELSFRCALEGAEYSGQKQIWHSSADCSFKDVGGHFYWWPEIKQLSQIGVTEEEVRLVSQSTTKFRGISLRKLDQGFEFYIQGLEWQGQSSVKLASKLASVLKRENEAWVFDGGEWVIAFEGKEFHLFPEKLRFSGNCFTPVFGRMVIKEIVKTRGLEEPGIALEFGQSSCGVGVLQNSVQESLTRISFQKSLFGN